MSDLAAQVSLYPLGADDLSPQIDTVIEIFQKHGLHVEIGPMSTLLSGEEGTLFAALHEAARAAGDAGKMVMVVTISNACTVAMP